MTAFLITMIVYWFIILVLTVEAVSDRKTRPTAKTIIVVMAMGFIGWAFWLLT